MIKDGYKFICWNTAPDGSDSPNYYAGDVREFKSDTVLYAQWSEVVTVSFNANGATGTVPEPFSKAGAVFVTFPDPTELVRPGFEFQYWCSTPVRTTDSDTYSIGDYRWFDEDTVFYAIWEEIVTVSYDLNGGTGTTPDSVTSTNHYIRTARTPEDIEREGFQFQGWNTQADGEGTDYDTNEWYTFEHSTVLYAKWEALPVVTLSYDLNGGTGQKPPSRQGYIFLSTTVAFPEGMSREGYEFVCWTKNPESSGGNFDPGDNITIYEDTVLYAVWNQVIMVTVSFDANGGTGSVPGNITGRAPLNVTVPAKPSSLQRDGYEFVFWNTQSDGNGLSYAPDEVIRDVSEDFTLYAKWQKLNRITYYPNGGTGSVPDSYEVSDWDDITVAYPPADLKRDGYAFDGWNSIADGSGKSYSPGETVTDVVWDIDFYAQWKKLITVKYDANGGDGPVPEPHVGLPTLHVILRQKPDSLTKKGSYFYSWNSQQSGQGVDY